MDQNTKRFLKPLKLFYAYAPEDRSLLARLEAHLSLLKREDLITPWSDRSIIPGTNWVNAINEYINSADIVLLLISPDFLASDYAYSSEMALALKRHQKGETRVIPIILRPTFIENSPFSHLQFLPRNGKPVTSWTDINEAFFEIAAEIKRICDQIRSEIYFSSSEEKSLDISSRLNLQASSTHLLSEVFIKSGIPNITFVAKEDAVFLRLALEQAGRGMIIEGPSGIGKTTAIKKAVEELKSISSKAHLSVQEELTARKPEHRHLLQTIREWSSPYLSSKIKELI